MDLISLNLSKLHPALFHEHVKLLRSCSVWALLPFMAAACAYGYYLYIDKDFTRSTKEILVCSACSLCAGIILSIIVTNIWLTIYKVVLRFGDVIIYSGKIIYVLYQSLKNLFLGAVILMVVIAISTFFGFGASKVFRTLMAGAHEAIN
ncbi:hypothetical protein [Enterobacter sp.]|uniref:hypothetical protein n=1 Tax=Enterobacter sp. TaxID=42895 RepID=UPI00296FE66A|nr:hypothetical protein [Enterobacter sp.]